MDYNDNYYTTYDSTPSTAFQDDTTGSAIGGILICVYIVVLILSIYAYYKIITKAGYPGWYLLLFFVPILNFFLMFLFAFSKWPIEQRVEELEDRLFESKKKFKETKETKKP